MSAGTATWLDPSPDPPVSSASSDRRSYPLLVVLASGLLVAELDQTVFATALPTVAGELHGVDRMLWVNTAYVAAATISMPVYGKVGDLLGRTRLFVAALAVFVAGSVVGALATSMGILIAGRTVQGLGGGGLLILVQAMVADTVPARRRAPYLSAIGAVFALAAVLGPVLGGWLTDGPGWRWALWINVPLGVTAIVAARLLPDPPRRRTTRWSEIDVRGIVLLAVAVTAIVGLTSLGGTSYPWGSPVVTGLGAIALVAAVVFVLVERRAVEPVIPLGLFGDRNVGVAVFAGLAMAVAMFGVIGYLPTYLQMVAGLDPTRAGLMMLSAIGGLGLATAASAQWVSRTGRYKALPVVGSSLVAVALLLLSTLGPTSGLPLTGGYLFVFGAGIGCTWEVLLLIVQNSVSAGQVGTATATYSFFREIGVSLGSAVVGTLFTSRLVTLLGERPPTGVDVSALTPARLAKLTPGLRAGVAAAYRDALTPVFLATVPLLVVSALALTLIRPVPLAGTLPRSDDADAR